MLDWWLEEFYCEIYINCIIGGFLHELIKFCPTLLQES